MIPHTHRTHRSGWLRAGVLGANDGVLSTASLMLGVAAAHTGISGLLIAGLAGLVGGSLSMGAGEYVSVSSQADTERADLALETTALAQDFDAERAELRDIYVRRGLDLELAARVAQQLMTHDALDAHARDEIGITDALSARPLQAACTSALSFALGALVPLIACVSAPAGQRMAWIAGVSLAFLCLLGVLAARAGGAPLWRGGLRVLVWGALVMAITSGVGASFGARA